MFTDGDVYADIFQMEIQIIFRESTLWQYHKISIYCIR
jgi:hypothetical protein